MINLCLNWLLCSVVRLMKVELMHDSAGSSTTVHIQEPSYVKREMRHCSLN